MSSGDGKSTVLQPAKNHTGEDRYHEGQSNFHRRDHRTGVRRLISDGDQVDRNPDQRSRHDRFD